MLFFVYFFLLPLTVAVKNMSCGWVYPTGDLAALPWPLGYGVLFVSTAEKAWRRTRPHGPAILWAQQGSSHYGIFEWPSSALKWHWHVKVSPVDVVISNLALSSLQWKL